MKPITLTSDNPQFPTKLCNIPSPPKTLYFLSKNPPESFWGKPMVAIIGSRKVSTYGRTVTRKLAFELAQAGLVTISGLALGIDGIAHEATLEAGGQTIAILPSSLDTIYPASHRNLAMRILQQGGALISEYPEGAEMAFKANFIARNRLVSGLSDGLLITEAAEKSGTLHTARFALEQGKDVMAVPGNITSPTSAGTNNLIKSGATPVTCTDDILFALKFAPVQAKNTKPKGSNEHEQLILDLLTEGPISADELLVGSRMDTPTFSQHLTMLEITGKIRNVGNNQWTAA